MCAFVRRRKNVSFTSAAKLWEVKGRIDSNETVSLQSRQRQRDFHGLKQHMHHAEKVFLLFSRGTVLPWPFSTENHGLAWAKKGWIKGLLSFSHTSRRRRVIQGKSIVLPFLMPREMEGWRKSIFLFNCAEKSLYCAKDGGDGKYTRNFSWLIKNNLVFSRKRGRMWVCQTFRRLLCEEVRYRYCCTSGSTLLWREFSSEFILLIFFCPFVGNRDFWHSKIKI